MHLEVPPEYECIVAAAAKAIVRTMRAGAHQRALGDPNEWKTRAPEQRMHNAHMHLVRTETHMGTDGHPWSVTDNTGLYDWEHALTGLGIVATHRYGMVNDKREASPTVTVDVREIEASGE